METLQNGNAENSYNEFKSNRKLVNETIAEAKRNYYIHKFQHSKNNKNTWTILRELGIGNIKPTLSCDTDLDDLNHKFWQSNLPEFTNNTYLTSLESCDRNNCDIIFSFNCVCQCDVLKPILSIKSNATGLDEINPKILKRILPSPPLRFPNLGK